MSPKPQKTRALFCAFLTLLSGGPAAHAGFLGAMVGDAIIHHEEVKARETGRPSEIIRHPLISRFMGAAAGSSVEGMAVRNFAEHPIRDSLIGAGAITIGGAYLIHKYRCHVVDPARPGSLALWACEGVQGNHTWVQEAKDLLYLKRSNTAKLERSLEAAGESRPKGCAAHHIVPQNEGRSWAKDDADRARKVLGLCKIPIDSAENGVWLPAQPEAECEGKWHPSLHTRAYYKEIADKLQKSFDKNGCKGVKQTLTDLKNALSKG